MKVIGLYPRAHADATGDGVVAHAGAVVLVDTIRAVGLDKVLSAELGRWRKPTAEHDHGKVVCDVALMLASGGDCLADIALLRAEPVSNDMGLSLERQLLSLLDDRAVSRVGDSLVIAPSGPAKGVKRDARSEGGDAGRERTLAGLSYRMIGRSRSRSSTRITWCRRRAWSR